MRITQFACGDGRQWPNGMCYYQFGQNHNRLMVANAPDKDFLKIYTSLQQEVYFIIALKTSIKDVSHIF